MASIDEILDMNRREFDLEAEVARAARRARIERAEKEFDLALKDFRQRYQTGKSKNDKH